MFKIKDYYTLLTISYVYYSVQATQRAPKIAVIGAGVGGTSFSYFTKELFGDENIEVDVYEANEVGGRLATIDIDGQRYETGGSIIHPDNRYMAHFCKKFDLQKKEGSDFSRKFALYDGKEIVFSESQWEITTLIKLLWRYGFSPLRLSNHVEKMLSYFKRIYQLQELGKSFNSVEDLLKAMSPEFIEDVKISSEKGFAELGISNNTINELIMAGLLVNFGQTTSAHKFVGLVSVSAENGHLWAISGGNKQVPEKLLKYSGANLIKEKVTKISLNKESGQFNISYSPLDNVHLEKDIDTVDQQEKRNSVNKTYDIIIMAAPLTRDTSDIVFENFPSTFMIPEGRYHRTVATIVKGDLNYKYFGQENDIDEIYSIKNTLIINSVGMIQAVEKSNNKKGSKIWKVFSQEPLSDNDLKLLFEKLEEVKVVDWLAYPHYESNQKLGSFSLHKNFYYINAIEWAASAMEMSVIGAKNVALLAYKDWTNENLNYNQRDEL